MALTVTTGADAEPDVAVDIPVPPVKSKVSPLSTWMFEPLSDWIFQFMVPVVP